MSRTPNSDRIHWGRFVGIKMVAQASLAKDLVAIDAAHAAELSTRDKTIEELRAELDRMAGLRNFERDERKAIRAENERLTKAATFESRAAWRAGYRRARARFGKAATVPLDTQAREYLSGLIDDAEDHIEYDIEHNPGNQAFQREIVKRLRAWLESLPTEKKNKMTKPAPVFIRRRFGILFFHEPGNPRDTWSVADPWVSEDTGKKELKYLMRRLARDYSCILVEPSMSIKDAIRKFRAIRKHSFACRGIDTEGKRNE